MKKESPEYSKLSLAAAMTLEFIPGRFWRNAKMTCINLLLHYTDGCKANCSYCGLARDRISKERTFIHVPWPLELMDDIIARLNASKIARRTCISMITHKRACDDTLSMTRRLSRESPQPVSILMGPTLTDKNYLEELKKAGAEKIGIAIDAATQELFEKHRGREAKGPHKWEDYWKRFEEAVDVFGGKNVGSHFICGLGEREEDLVRCFQRIRDLGGENHLFSFFPEPGSRMGNIKPPPLDNYRRIQIACDIIDKALASFEDFAFEPDSGKILDFGVSKEVLNTLISSGEPFRTRGCKNCHQEVDCNRPYGNSYPGPHVRNYPFAPTIKDLALIKTQIASSKPEQKAVVFSVPNIKTYDTDEFSNRGKTRFLAFSVTGSDCSLMCDHCRAVLLQPMIPAKTPEILWRKTNVLAKNGNAGILVSGGCDREGIVPLLPFVPILARIKTELKIPLAVHTKLVNPQLAKALSSTGIDAVMVDVVDTPVLQEVYHLKHKTREHVVKTLDLLEEYNLPAAPHIILGLHKGMNRERGEVPPKMSLLEILKGRRLKSLVIVFHMPLLRTPMKKVSIPPVSRLNPFFKKAREMFPEIPVHLGCARPPGDIQKKLEILALKHGFDGIAFPSEETVNLAKKRKYSIRFQQTCCALL